jgi:phosphoribosylformylglycinamidine synthase
MKKIAIIQYPGSNCEYETAGAVRASGMEAEIFRWNRDAVSLDKYDGYIIPGGFSYQDRVRAGAIAAKKSIMRTIFGEAAKGKPVLGICNGAQVLVESGMIPGVNPGELEMALAPNAGTSGYYCNWVHVVHSTQKGKCAFTCLFEKSEVFPIPVAHAEGRFVTRKKELIESLDSNGQIVLRYSTADGKVEDRFPVNPNGSTDNIAGICNPSGNVLALMPHPERAAWLRQVPDDTGDEYAEAKRAAYGNWQRMTEAGPGRKIFESMREYLEDIPYRTSREVENC